MLLEEAISSGPMFFSLAPWIVFFPVIGLLFNIIFGGIILERGKSGEKIVGAIASGASGITLMSCGARCRSALDC